MGACHAPDLLIQEGHQQPSASTHSRCHLQDRILKIEYFPDESFNVALRTPEIDLSKIKGTGMAMPILPDVFSLFIGRIAVSWSQFDQGLSHFLKPLCVSNGQSPHVVDIMRAFKKRKTLCRNQAELQFGRTSNIYKHINSLLEDAANLAVKRNSILHGKVTAKVKAFPGNKGEQKFEFSMLAKGGHNGADIEVEFSLEAIEELFHDFASIEYRMNRLSISRLENSHMTFQDFSSTDRSLLLALLRVNS